MKIMDLSEYQEAIKLIVDSGAVSLPLVVTCGLATRVFNALFSAICGEKRLKL